MGGEWGGAARLALEYGHRGRRGLHASWPQAGIRRAPYLDHRGLLISASSLRGAVPRLGLCIPFYLSGLLIVVGLLIRVRILEMPLFRRLQETDNVAGASIAETLSRHRREVLLAAGSRISENSCFYLFAIYVLTYGEKVLHLGQEQMLLAVSIAAAVEFFTIPLWGILSDYWSRKGVFLMGSLVVLGFAGPYYWLLGTRQPAAVVLAVVGSLALGHAMLYSVQGSLIPELFGTRLRYTGALIGYQLAAPVAGGTAPLIATGLMRQFPGQSWPLIAYIIGICLLSLLCVHFLAETLCKDLTASGD